MLLRTELVDHLYTLSAPQRESLLSHVLDVFQCPNESLAHVASSILSEIMTLESLCLWPQLACFLREGLENCCPSPLLLHCVSSALESPSSHLLDSQPQTLWLTTCLLHSISSQNASAPPLVLLSLRHILQIQNVFPVSLLPELIQVSIQCPYHPLDSSLSASVL